MLDSFTLGLLLPRAPLTTRHMEELEDEVGSILGGSKQLILRVPRFPPEEHQPFVRHLLRVHKLAPRISAVESIYERPYQMQKLSDWLAESDRIMAFPSRATCGRIVDRVWGAVTILRGMGAKPIISYPKDR